MKDMKVGTKQNSLRDSISGCHISISKIPDTHKTPKLLSFFGEAGEKGPLAMISGAPGSTIWEEAQDYAPSLAKWALILYYHELTNHKDCED